jgi:hypothetical protein
MSNSARWSRVSIWQLVQEAPPGGTIARWRRGSITVGTTRDGFGPAKRGTQDRALQQANRELRNLRCDVMYDAHALAIPSRPKISVADRSAPPSASDLRRASSPGKKHYDEDQADFDARQSQLSAINSTRLTTELQWSAHGATAPTQAVNPPAGWRAQATSRPSRTRMAGHLL